MNECSEAWDEYVPAGMERVLALLPCVCVCVCKRRREGESVHWAEMGPCPSWIFSCSPPTTFYWCLTDVSLRVGKRVGPVKQHSPKAVLAAAKKGDVLSRSSPKMQKKRKKKCAGAEPVTTYRWVKCSWSHVALLNLGQHLGHMFRSVTLHSEIL